MVKTKEIEGLPEAEEPQVDETAELLRQAAEGLAKAAATRADRGAILKEVEGVLSKIRLKDVPELADSPIVQAFLTSIGVSDLAPGQAKAKGTLAEREREWTWQDMRKLEQVTFIPIITERFTINGVGPVQMVAGEEIRLPKPYYDRYREVLEARKQAGIHERYLLGLSDAAPHPNWQTDEAARVRASSLLGLRGQSTGHLSYGPIREDDEGAASA